MNDLSVAEAAKLLDLSPQRVRAMLQGGGLQGHKVGRVWIVDSEVLQQRRHTPGRPLSAANAWALLAMLSGDSPDWVDPTVRSRLKRRAKDPAWLVQSLIEGIPRSRVHLWRVLPSDLSKVRESWDLVLSGLSAQLPELDVLGGFEGLDFYADEDSIRHIERRFQPDRESATPNLLIRNPTHPWILKQPGQAPRAVVAADLIVNEDPRVARAARQLLSSA
jgi:excisionase family DNA binding protein